MPEAVGCNATATVKSAWQAARQPNVGPKAKLILQQLDTLLLAAQTSCQALGAELFVLGDDDLRGGG